jgi:general secretion pathway protein G
VWACARQPGFTLIELMLVVAIIGTLTLLASPYLETAVDRARVTRAIGELRRMVVDIQVYQAEHFGEAPNSLADIDMEGAVDPWGRPYEYLKFPSIKGGGGHPQGARKDRFLVPINSAFDLYSVGKDGQSVAPLTASKSRDDVVVANDGGFVGIAVDF